MSPQQPRGANKPEKKIGPYLGGLGVAVWLNTVQTKEGKKKVRSITINPRRYRDAQGKWQDSFSYRINDVPALILALQEALQYAYTTRIPGEDADTSTQPF